MKAAVIVFPGSNSETDSLYGLQLAGYDATAVWHTETGLPAVDLIVLPGGFSYGDHLRSGAIAARSRVLAAVSAAAERGVPILGICNGFQILTEAGLLPGALLTNSGVNFVCRTVTVEVSSNATPFTGGLAAGTQLQLPVAHQEGRYYADGQTLEALEAENRVVFRYAAEANPNGSLNDIAGISNARGNVVGMMPHPERALEQLLGSADGLPLLQGPLNRQVRA